MVQFYFKRFVVAVSYLINKFFRLKTGAEMNAITKGNWQWKHKIGRD